MDGKTRRTANPGCRPPDEEEGQEYPAEAVYRCQVYLLPEEDGGFSVVSATLPGVASQGDTEEEALANIVEAFQEVLLSYKEEGRKIPWLETPREPDEEGARTRWVSVHVSATERLRQGSSEDLCQGRFRRGPRPR